VNRYHKKIYFPHINELKTFNNSVNDKTWHFSNHALDRVYQKLSYIEIEKLLNEIKNYKLNEKNIFEYYEENNKILKVCYRVSFGKYKDMILVINRDKKLITIYLNNTDDKHITLDKTLYTQEV